jgi:queuine/archaeosine tRNA-ribosyltransferase
MPAAEQERAFARTMAVNESYRHDGYVPVIHVGLMLERYVVAMERDGLAERKQGIALGGIVPNLLRAPKALPYADVLGALARVRRAFASTPLHVFGLGGTATLHLAALLGIDSADSSGWRNRAARGIVQLPGRGDRMVANLGSWRGRTPDAHEWETLAACPCPACRRFGVDGLKAGALHGFCNRATHNLWVLLDEAREVDRRLGDGSYGGWFENHLENSIYLPLVRRALALRRSR